ncbi:helix-turn-helix domain-containing protein [Azospirillum ramasamyi]|uniref:Helix-turn-helix domain-containing protein n=1 Tax=Azospirillum ramasamyi TaxID=682998 RepID=A0A2U9S9L4_9PROT|nr:helix-turn-helix domain-containing protein [Azospirillum ramasamyi]AWU96215.1 helix-turn-helix domain-containing protein [Azospirillum ramasamyi]
MTDHSANPNRWGRIPAWWLDHPELDADGLAVLAALSTYADDMGVCWPSQATLAGKLKRSRPTVNRILGRLEALGLVTIEHRRSASGGRLSCRYRLALTVTDDAGQGARVDSPADSAMDSPCPAASHEQLEPEQNPDTLHRRAGRPRVAGQEPAHARSVAKPAPKPTAEPVDQDWTPSATDRQWAASRFPAVDLDRHAERFVQQCRAHGYRYRDVAAAWRSWLLQDMTRMAQQPAEATGNPANRANRKADARPDAKRSANRPAADAEQRLSAWASVAARLNGQPGAAAGTANPWGVGA